MIIMKHFSLLLSSVMLVMAQLETSALTDNDGLDQESIDVRVTIKDGQGVSVENVITVIVPRGPSDVNTTDSPTILRGPSDSTATFGSEVSIGTVEC